MKAHTPLPPSAEVGGPSASADGGGSSDGTLSGRLDNNLTVEFAADPALMGSYAQVHLTGARATVLLGELET